MRPFKATHAHVMGLSQTAWCGSLSHTQGSRTAQEPPGQGHALSPALQPACQPILHLRSVSECHPHTGPGLCPPGLQVLGRVNRAPSWDLHFQPGIPWVPSGICVGTSRGGALAGCVLGSWPLCPWPGHQGAVFHKQAGERWAAGVIPLPEISMVVAKARWLASKHCLRDTTARAHCSRDSRWGCSWPSPGGWPAHWHLPAVGPLRACLLPAAGSSALTSSLPNPRVMARRQLGKGLPGTPLASPVSACAHTHTHTPTCMHASPKPWDKPGNSNSQ